MKKIILLALTALMMVGCWGEPTGDYNMIRTIVIDSCEYLQYSLGQGFSHKGNCRFCKERRQKELEELVIKLKENKNPNKE